MNVHVVIPRPLQPACEGRARIELGVPAGADVAEVLHTLLLLYPGLRAWQPNEQPGRRPHFTVALHGHTLILFAEHTGRA